MMLNQMLEKKVDSWAIRWWWTVFNNQGLALSPDKSLVQYLPSGNQATHVKGDVLPFTHHDFDKNYFIESYPDKLVVNNSYYENVKEALLRITNFSPQQSPKYSFKNKLKHFFDKNFRQLVV
jgi:hypothetical protein